MRTHLKFDTGQFSQSVGGGALASWFHLSRAETWSLEGAGRGWYPCPTWGSPSVVVSSLVLAGSSPQDTAWLCKSGFITAMSCQIFVYEKKKQISIIHVYAQNEKFVKSIKISKPAADTREYTELSLLDTKYRYYLR